MFIRTKKTPRSKSVSIQLVESFRDRGKIKQRVIHHFGTAETEEKLKALMQLAEAMKVELKHRKLCAKTVSVTEIDSVVGKLQNVAKNTYFAANDLEEVQRYILGIHDVYGYVYEQIGFTNPFHYPARRAYAAKLLREIVLARIACPKSKRASVAMLGKQFGMDINLDHVYQMMDKIDDVFCDRIQNIALATTLKFTGGKLRILFYDATTLYFESFIEDELKQNGYSKDMKFNQSQVLLALFVTEDGLPVGYELFPGATYEGHTLIPVLEKLKNRYQIEQVVFVADRGLLSEDNIKYLEDNNFTYIVGARIKNLSKQLKDKILDSNNYSMIDGKKIAIFEYTNNRKLVVSYSIERAEKDRHDREKSVAKLYKKIDKDTNPKSLLSNYGYKKYIELKGDAKIEINKTKLEEDSKWDGLLGVITNVDEFAAEQILVHYRSLWQIEECFRVNKHDLKMRPIYHWTPNRVKAHIAISFIAFVCVRYLEYRLKVQSQKISPEVIRDALMQVQASVIRDKKTETHFLLPAKINPHAKEIYRVLGIKVPEMAMLIR
jgi:transposase